MYETAETSTGGRAYKKLSPSLYLVAIFHDHLCLVLILRVHRQHYPIYKASIPSPVISDPLVRHPLVGKFSEGRRLLAPRGVDDGN